MRALPQLLTDERIENIAAEVRAGADVVGGNRQAQRTIFQLLDVHVTLSCDDQQRWVDVTCTLGNERYAVEYNNLWC